MSILDRFSKKQGEEQMEKKKAPAKKAAPKKAATKAVASDVVEAKKSAAESNIKFTGSTVLIRPLVTEKAAVMASQNKYSFIVSFAANKTQIKQAVKEQYNVNPMSVQVSIMQGKGVRFGASMGKRTDFKKAIVTLPKGESIAIHEGV